MLIDLCLPLTLNPYEYPTTLAIRLETDNRPECGVFAGRHTDFSRNEEGKTVPLIDDDGTGRKTFILDRDGDRGSGRLCRTWHYAAVGWTDGIYVDHPYVYTLTLREYAGNDADGLEKYFWAVSVSRTNPLFQLLLPDYEPDAVARGVAFPIIMPEGS
jgi:hypothetical protein